MSFHDESDAFVKPGRYSLLPFKMAEALCGVCNLLGFEFAVVLRPIQGEDRQLTIVSCWENPGDLRPILEEVLGEVRKAEAEDVKGESTQ